VGGERCPAQIFSGDSGRDCEGGQYVDDKGAVKALRPHATREESVSSRRRVDLIGIIMDEDIQLEFIDLYPEESDCWPDKGSVKILTQKQLIEELRDHGITVCSRTIHSWIRSGCPTVPGWKKPRFLFAQVLYWIQSDHPEDPLPQKTIDRLYKRRLGRTA
jgi:hypothetical protein